MTRHRRDAGFTLVELMLALGVGAIVSATFFETLISQQAIYLTQLEYGQAQQNARAALGIVENYARTAGYGLPPGNKFGPIPVGSCDNSTDADICNSLDAGSDRLRIQSGDSASFSGTSDVPGNSFLYVQEKVAGVPCSPAVPAGTTMFVTATCQDDSTVTDVFTITSDTVDSNNGKGKPFCHKMDFASGTKQCNYKDAQTISAVLNTYDFRIDRTVAAHPKLVLTTGGQTLDVAYDIDDLQVEYGLDITPPVNVGDSEDNVVDLWCRQLTTDACASGLATTRDNQARVIALKVAVVARTASPQKGYSASAVTVFDHAIAGGDGYRRWVYRAAIALRSINL